jgi:hypothetical protein
LWRGVSLLAAQKLYELYGILKNMHLNLEQNCFLSSTYLPYQHH